MRARDALCSTNGKVSGSAFGYERPARFLREYARTFGVPPRLERTLHVMLDPETGVWRGPGCGAA